MVDNKSTLVPPDTISNSEVKRRSGDDSVGSPYVKVAHCQPFFLLASVACVVIKLMSIYNTHATLAFLLPKITAGSLWFARSLLLCAVPACSLDSASKIVLGVFDINLQMACAMLKDTHDIVDVWNFAGFFL